MFLALAPILATVASLSAPTSAAPPSFTRAQMESALRDGAPFRIVYGTQTPDAGRGARERAWMLAPRFGLDSTAVLADRAISAESLAAHPVLLIGGPAENAWTARFAAALPVAFTTRGFRFEGREYTEPGDVIHLVWPHPLAPRRFLLLVAGNRAAGGGANGDGVLFGDEDWRITRDGELLRSGTFAQDGGTPWRYDPALDRDLEAMRERFAASLTATREGGVTVMSAPGTPRIDAIARAAAALADRLDRSGFRSTRSTPIRVTLYPSLERKGLLTGNTRPEHVDASGAAHIGLAADRDAADLESVAAARLVALGGDREAPWLRAAAVWLAGRFEGEPLSAALARLYFGRLLPRAPATASAASSGGGEGDDTWRSPRIWTPARALLVGALLDVAGGRGRDAVLAIARATAPGTLDSLCRVAGVSAPAVERRYAALADSLARAGERGARVDPTRVWRPREGFQAGVSLAHRTRLDSGYLSAACGAELTRLRGAGAAWIAVTPYGYLAEGLEPAIAPSADGGPDQETDEAVAEVAARAHAAGLRVWLAPRLWTRGAIAALAYGPAGWSRFFAHYRAFILHHALLAERERVDGLVIGRELATAALQYPDRWRALIADVRRVYSGTITYEASCGAEVEGIAFWDALDLIGVSFDAPLAEKPTGSVAALEPGARRALAALQRVAARAGRPVVLLEAGYPPQSTAALAPRREGGGAFDPEMQRACDEALVRALEPETWVAGVFWWPWLSDGSAPRTGELAATPRGQPAEAVVRRALASWAGRPVTIPRPPSRPSGRPSP
jgi:hypothetical protein